MMSFYELSYRAYSDYYMEVQEEVFGYESSYNFEEDSEIYGCMAQYRKPLKEE